jgi:cytochrome c2
VKAALAVGVIVVAGAILVLVLLLGFGGHSTRTERESDRAKQAIVAYGCGGCHQIEGVTDANGKVGPSLHGLADRRVIAGSLPNTPKNVAQWIADPKTVDPNTLMPDLGVTRSQAQAIADYLYEH